jgi:autophagy-related protein 5
LIDPDTTAPHHGWFTHEDVPLKWHYPIGLLFDLYSGAEPASADDDQNLGSTIKNLKAGTARGTQPSIASLDSEPGGVSLSSPPNETSEEVSSDDEPQGTLPWRLTVHFTSFPNQDLIPLDSTGATLLDAFRNSLKEASFVRHSTGKVVMSLGYDDSTQLWRAVEEDNLALYLPIYTKLLDPPGLGTKNIPIRLFLPNASTPPSGALPSSTRPDSKDSKQAADDDVTPAAGTLRVVQGLIPPHAPGGSSRQQPQTLGMALNTLLPALFPSRRSPLLALPVLHGAVLPLAAGVEELSRFAAYADGWLHISVRMMT